VLRQHIWQAEQAEELNLSLVVARKHKTMHSHDTIHGRAQVVMVKALRRLLPASTPPPVLEVPVTDDDSHDVVEHEVELLHNLKYWEQN
jgi:hypothetical protein